MRCTAQQTAARISSQVSVRSQLAARRIQQCSMVDYGHKCNARHADRVVACNTTPKACAVQAVDICWLCLLLQRKCGSNVTVYHVDTEQMTHVDIASNYSLPLVHSLNVSNSTKSCSVREDVHEGSFVRYLELTT